MSTQLNLRCQRAVVSYLLPLLACAIVPSPLAAQLGLGLSPMRVEMRFAGPGVHSGALTLTNDSGGKVRIRGEILDFFIDPTETPQFARTYTQEAEYSCRAWLSLNPMEVELESGATTLIRYTVRMPAGVRERSYHCAAGFTTLPPAEQMAGTSLKTAIRIVAAFYAVVGQPALEGELKSIHLEPAPKVKNGEPGDWRAVVVLQNHSEMHFRPTGELAVLDARGQVVETRSFNSLPVLPKREQRFLFPLKSSLAGGKYTLRARVDLGAHDVQEATAEVTPKR